LLALLPLAALVVCGVAAAGHLDPQKRLRPADQARAKAMVLKKGDLEGNFESFPGTTLPHNTCSGLDQSRLTLTGEATSPAWLSSSAYIVGAANVFVSVGDANASWKRLTSAVGGACTMLQVGSSIGDPGGIAISLGRVPFPRVAPKTVVYRVVASSRGRKLVIDAIALQRSRAQVFVTIAGLEGRPPPRAEELRLSRLLAKRMERAMRGS
jgi:hypothetical protein